MNREPQAELPPEVVVLGRALRPTLAKLSATLSSGADRGGRGGTRPRAAGEVATIALVQRGLSRLANACDDVVAKVEELGRGLAAGSDELAIYRAVGAFEAHLQLLQDGYVEVLAWGGTKRARQGRDLLAEIYRDTLTQIEDWIKEIVDTVEEPLAAVRRRGMQAQREVTLTIMLTLRPPPELEQLVRWANGNTASKGDGIGFWGIVAGTALGIGIADLLFLEDE